MKKINLILITVLVFTLSLVGVYALAQAPNPGHSANNIGPGNFQPGGDYSFPTNVGINGTLDVGSGILTSGGISIGTGAGVNTTHLGNNTLQIMTDTSYGGTYDRHSGFLVYSIMPGGWGTAQLRFAHSEDWKTYDTENPTMVLDGGIVKLDHLQDRSGGNLHIRSNDVYIRNDDDSNSAHLHTSVLYTGWMQNAGEMNIVAGGTSGSNANVYIRGLNAEGTALADNAVLHAHTMYATVKPFLIDHPTKSGMKLVHVAIEGPEAAVYYRGEAKLKNGKAVVKLPSYFEVLTRKKGRTVLLTCKEGWSPLYVSGNVKDAKFLVESAWKNSNQKFYWEVKAVRADVPILQTERNASEFK